MHQPFKTKLGRHNFQGYAARNRSAIMHIFVRAQRPIQLKTLNLLVRSQSWNISPLRSYMPTKPPHSPAAAASSALSNALSRRSNCVNDRRTPTSRKSPDEAAHSPHRALAGIACRYRLSTQGHTFAKRTVCLGSKRNVIPLTYRLAVLKK